MKKFSIYFLIMMCLFVVGCSSNTVKDVATLDTFDSVLTGKNFSVTEAPSNYNGVDYITDARKATLNDIEIEMIVYSDSDSASKVHESHIESFNLVKSTGALEEKDKGKNYYSYSLISNGYYMISSRIDNTLIFCKTQIENKELVEEIFSEIGY